MRTDIAHALSPVVLLASCLLALLAVAGPAGRAERAAPDAVVVVDAQRVEGSVSPLFFGQFIEIMYNCLDGGLWAEQIRGRGFENPDPNRDGVPDPWNPIGKARFATDGATSVPRLKDGRSHSQRIELSAGEAGIWQAPVAVSKGDPYRVSLWLKSSGGPVTAQAALRAGKSLIASVPLKTPSSRWVKSRAILAPRASDNNARFEITARGKGTLWIDQVSMVPESSAGGWRRDVLEAVQPLNPSVLRFPGGNFAQCYHWADGIGERDKRPTTVNHAWSDWMESNNVGTDEFIQLCRLIGCEPLICVNIGDGDSPKQIADNSSARALKDAVNWLEYCNGAPDTPFGRLRAKNGHPEPYRVKYWEIGNEINGFWEIGNLPAGKYADRLVQFARALRAKDPGIEILACGADTDWNRAVLERAGGEIDWLFLHHYYRSPSFADTVADALNLERYLSDTAALCRRHASPGRPIRISLNEWNMDGGPMRNHSLTSLMFGASLLNAMLRQSDAVQMQCVSDMVNGWAGGLVQADHAGCFVTPTYHLLRLHANNHGPARLHVRVDCETFDSPAQGGGHPVLDAVATRAENGGHLCVSLVNKSLSPLRVAVALRGCKDQAPRALLHTLTAADVATYNTRAKPDAIRPHTSAVPVEEGIAWCELPGPSANILVAETGGIAATVRPALPRRAVKEAQPAAPLVGTVVDELGKPVAGARVEVRGSADATTNAAGRFAIDRAPDRDAQIAVTMEGFGLCERALSAGGRAPLRFELSRLPVGAVWREDFDGRSLRQGRWQAPPTWVKFGVRDGGLRLESAPGTAGAAFTRPISGTGKAAVSIETRVVEFVGQAISIHVYAERAAAHRNITWTLRDGGIEAADPEGMWWPAEWRVAMPCDLRIEVTAPDGSGWRDARLYYNGALFHTFRRSKALRGGNLLVGLGGGNCRACWDRLTVDAIR